MNSWRSRKLGAGGRAILRRRAELRQKRLYHVPRHVRETEVAALVAGDEAQVVESECVEYGRLNIVNVDRVFHDIPTPLVGLAVGEATAEATAEEE